MRLSCVTHGDFLVSIFVSVLDAGSDSVITGRSPDYLVDISKKLDLQVGAECEREV